MTRELGIGEIAAKVNGQQLLRSIADSIADGLERGFLLARVDGMRAFDLEQLAAHPAIVADHRRSQLERRINEQQQIAATARDNANRATDQEVIAGFIADAEAAMADLRRLRSRLDNLSRDAEPRPIPHVLTLDRDYITAALARLRTCSGYLPGEDCDALERIIDDFRAWPADDELRWECSVLLPANGQVLRAGPFTGTVPVRPVSPARRLGEICIPLARELIGPNALSEAQRGRRGRDRLQRRIVAALRDQGLHHSAAIVLARCPLDEVGVAVLHLLQRRPPEPHHDAEWLELIHSTYFNRELRWRTGVYAERVGARQLVLDALVARPDKQATMTSLAADLDGQATYRQIVHYTYDRTKDGSVWTAAVRRVSDRPLRVALHDCSCGGYASVTIRVPETSATSLLCPDCLRPPGGPPFPREYLQLKDTR